MQIFVNHMCLNSEIFLNIAEFKTFLLVYFLHYYQLHWAAKNDIYLPDMIKKKIALQTKIRIWYIFYFIMFFFPNYTCTCLKGSCIKISTYLLSGSCVWARDFNFFAISSMLLNCIRSRSSLSFLSRTETANSSEFLILHTLVVVAEIPIGSTFPPRIPLIMLDFPLLVSPIKETPL